MRLEQYINNKVIRRTVWIAYDDKGIVATWYKDCTQPFLRWKQAVKNISVDIKFKFYNIALER